MEAVINAPASVSAATTTFSLMGHEIAVTLRTGDDRDNYVFEMTSPAGRSIPLHANANEDEVMYVAEGTFEITSGDEVFTATAGDCFSFPRNLAHGYTNMGDTDAKTVWFVTPGKNLEQCFDELSGFTEEESADKEKIGELGGRYGIRFL